MWRITQIEEDISDNRLPDLHNSSHHTKAEFTSWRHSYSNIFYEFLHFFRLILVKNSAFRLRIASAASSSYTFALWTGAKSSLWPQGMNSFDRRYWAKTVLVGHYLHLPNIVCGSWLWKIGHFQVPPGLCIRTRLSAQPLIWKWFFILTQVKLIFTRKVEHLASFWKWGFFELGSGLFSRGLELIRKTKNFEWIMITYVRPDKNSIKVFKIHLHVITITSATEQAVHVIHFFFPELLLLLWWPCRKILRLFSCQNHVSVHPRRIILKLILKRKVIKWKKIIAVIDATFAVAKRKLEISFSQLQKLRL